MEGMAFDQSKDSSSIVSQEKVENTEIDADRWVNGLMRGYGNSLVIVSVFPRKQKIGPSAENK
jgi:hypothetical protein